MSDDRIERINRRLHDAFNPTQLTVRDDSHKHVGHVGAQDGRGHFYVEIASEELTGLPRLKQHQKIYDALGPLMQTDIHALQIKVMTDPEP